MITGHRPVKLGGYSPENPLKQKLMWKFGEILDRAIIAANRKEENLAVISGMALGCDQWWASVALEKEVEVYAYIPFEGQESKWPSTAQQLYSALISKCKRIKVSCNAGYAAWKMQKRNRDMVDDADFCIAVWDGSTGGTANCVNYIKLKRKPLLLINPNTLEEEWYQYDDNIQYRNARVA